MRGRRAVFYVGTAKVFGVNFGRIGLEEYGR